MKNKIVRFLHPILGGYFLGVLCSKNETGLDLALTIVLAVGNIGFYILDFRKANDTRST